MKDKILLTTSNNARHVQVAWKPSAVVIMNNTPYSLLMRDGSQERPTITRYDYLVPPGMYTALPVIAHEFSFALDNDYPGAPSYDQPCTIMLVDEREALPDFGVSSYRQSLHQTFQLNAGLPTQNILLDTRTARAIYFSLWAAASAFGSQWWLPANGYITVHPGSTPAETAGTFVTSARVIMLPRPTPRVEGVIPLAANYTNIGITKAIADPVTIDCVLDIALLDEIPAGNVHYISDYRFSEVALVGPIPSQTVFEHVYSGRVPYIEIAIEPDSPGDPFDLTFYMHSGSPLQFSEVWRRRLSSDETITIAFGGPNALPTRGVAEFLGRDPVTGAVAWRFPLDLYFDRFMRLVVDVDSTGAVKIHAALHYVMEV